MAGPALAGRKRRLDAESVDWLAAMLGRGMSGLGAKSRRLDTPPRPPPPPPPLRTSQKRSAERSELQPLFKRHRPLPPPGISLSHAAAAARLSPRARACVQSLPSSPMHADRHPRKCL
eukprot:TRINITY_DN40682_c0_g1_i2.p2 TRINITY_DN40682_c0_g1~~TRINITY_DN40682_c0_g1_i2.p2  ORF type:complete len:136 (+),score=28.30 TRINITY_DN40682_c0_g1_i2:57-410(+)